MKNKLKYGVHYTDSDHVCVKECGSIIMPSGMKVKDIQARLGHSRSAIDTYSHLTQKMQSESVDIFEQAMRELE